MNQRTVLRRSFHERLAHAGQLLEDGASQSEVIRTTSVARETLAKYFPGQKWTYRQGGEFRALTRSLESKETAR